MFLLNLFYLIKFYGIICIYKDVRTHTYTHIYHIYVEYNVARRKFFQWLKGLARFSRAFRATRGEIANARRKRKEQGVGEKKDVERWRERVSACPRARTRLREEPARSWPLSNPKEKRVGSGRGARASLERDVVPWPISTRLVLSYAKPSDDLRNDSLIASKPKWQMERRRGVTLLLFLFLFLAQRITWFLSFLFSFLFIFFYFFIDVPKPF